MADRSPHTRARLRDVLTALPLKRLQAVAAELKLPRSGRKEQVLERLLGERIDVSRLAGLLTPEERAALEGEGASPAVPPVRNSKNVRGSSPKANDADKDLESEGPFEPLPWTLTVEGFGKIKRADVRPHPLTLFIGPNNSGKSYLASLMWGIVANGEQLFARFLELRSFQQVHGWWKDIFERHALPLSYELSAADIELLTHWLNDGLQRSKDKFVETLLNTNAVHTHSLSLALHACGREMSARLHEPDDGYATIEISFSGLVLSDHRVHETARRSLVADAIRVLPEWLLSGTRYLWQSDRWFWSEPISLFLPASRTGFMLTYKAVVQHQLRKLNPLASRDAPSIDLPLPAVSFLELLATGTDGTPGTFADLADFLEAAALGGRLELRRGQLNEFLYHPDDGRGPMDLSLAMHLSSSLVTELSPLIYVLRYSKQLQHLFIEEPEAHLHPHLQRVMAQVVTRLVRRGVFVWITTHSENFCQQINNFIKLGTLPNRSRLQQELGYEAQDYLHPQEVGAYQFANVDGHSEVTELERTEEGIAMPSFNEELYRLALETRRLRDAREET